MAQLVTGYVMRPVESRDEEAVLALVNADRVPGQPLATPAMLAEALAGRSGVDSDWWAELADLTTEVATTRAGQVVGAVSCASRPRDDAGVVSWLHGSEDRGVIDALLDHTLKVSRAFALRTNTRQVAGRHDSMPVAHTCAEQRRATPDGASR